MRMEIKDKRLMVLLSLFALMLLLAVAGDTGCSSTASSADYSDYFLPLGIAQPIGQTITALGVEDQDGSFLLYLQKLSWDAKGFASEYAQFSRDPGGYLSKFMQALTKEWGARGAEVSDWQISFTTGYDLGKQQMSYSATIQCQVRGSGVILSWGGEHPTFAFGWLLKPLGFDLYAFKYTNDSSLRWEGKLDNLPTTILLSFPWPIEHCHYHVWYKG